MFKKVVIAPDSFKGTISSVAFCNIIEEAFLKISPSTQIVKIPVADGGEGTVEAYIAGMGGKKQETIVRGPMGKAVSAEYGILQDEKTAVIEMAAAAGLPLMEGNLCPMEATTYGTGQQLMDAVDRGCKRIFLGIGGSACSDGGIGVLSALGVRFLDKFGKEVSLNANGLRFIRKIDASGLDKRLKDVEIQIACDVTNPLLGENGAARVYSPQKGANDLQVDLIEKGLAQYNAVLTALTGKDRKNDPGMGAAGGIALSLTAFLNARVESGIDLILDLCEFDKKIKNADFIITGEGKVDGQSVQGKVLAGIAKRAAIKNVPVVAIVGDVGTGYEKLYELGIAAIFSTNKAAVPFETAKLTSREDLQFLIENLLYFSKLNPESSKNMG